jgi:hypothetical protein
MKADTAPSLKLATARNENISFVQPRKRLPLKMIISEIASRDKDSVEIEQEHQTVYSDINNTSLHAKKRDPSRYSSYIRSFGTEVEYFE